MNAAASRSVRRAYIAQLRFRRGLLILLFALVVLFPLIVAAIQNMTNGTWREWPREVGSFAGMLGLTLMILSFVPITREHVVSNAFNLDAVYKFHHRFSTIGFFLAVAHLVTLWLNNHEIARLLNVFGNTPLYTKGGVFCLLAAGLLVYFSYFRKEFKIHYDFWKIGHSLIAIVMVTFGLIHTFGINYYSATPIIHWYFILLTALAILSVLWLRIISPIFEIQKPYRITDVVVMNNATTELKLAFDGKGSQQPVAYHSGQIGWISVRKSPFSFRKHPFSITSPDTEPANISFAIRNLGDFTASVKDLQVGERVYVEGGFGVFNPWKLGDEGFVMIAGGIGIAPVMGILRSMAARKDKRKVVLYYGSRDEESIGFYDELNELAKKISLTCVHVLERTDDPAFEQGYITQAVLERHYPQNKDRYDVFICGPGPMVQIVLPALKRMGIKEENIWPEFYDMA